MLFTSPSSTKDKSDDLDNLPPAPKKKKISHRANVAQRIQTASVVPRSIAYAAIHVGFLRYRRSTVQLTSCLSSSILHSRIRLGGLQLTTVTTTRISGTLLLISLRIPSMRKQKCVQRSFWSGGMSMWLSLYSCVITHCIFTAESSLVPTLLQIVVAQRWLPGRRTSPSDVVVLLLQLILLQLVIIVVRV